LAPKGRFISTEAVKRVVGQIGEPQKATRELSGRFRDWPACVFHVVRDALQGRVPAETVLIGWPEQRIDNLLRGRVNLAGEPPQMVGLNFEQPGFHGRRAAQPPHETG
jgi:hypothetical protein